MECPVCKSDLRIAQSNFESKKGSTDVHCVQLLVCVNPNCSNHEPNLENPSKVVDTVRNKVN